MKTPLLYDFPLSIACQMVRLALAEKGVAYDTRKVDITRPSEQFEGWYVELNPTAVVPTLDVDGEIFCEMKNIMRHLDAAFDGPALTPESTRARAEMEHWMAEADEIDYASLLYAVKRAPDGTCPPLELRSRKLQELRRSHPHLRAIVDRRLADNAGIRARLASEDGLDALREAVLDKVRRLDAVLAGRTFIIGEQYSIADAMWTATLARLALHGLDAWWSGGELPRVAAYYDRVRARPSWSDAKVFDHIPASFAAPPPSTAAPAERHSPTAVSSSQQSP